MILLMTVLVKLSLILLNNTGIVLSRMDLNGQFLATNLVSTPAAPNLCTVRNLQLRGNKWIHKYGGPWGIMVVLAHKSHQEHITDVEDFVWHMCVSCLLLTVVTKPFQFPIPRCDDAINILDCGSYLDNQS